MDEHNELPDDFSQWSDSYWDWFNLDSQSATYDELRKAYSRLIKHFRPETHPEQFQRIQAAFEILRELIQSGKSSKNGSKKLSESTDDKLNEMIQTRRSKRQDEFLNTLYNQYINNADWDGAKRFLLEAIEPPQPASDQQAEECADLDEIPYLYMFWLLYTLEAPNEDNLLELFKYLIKGEDVSRDENISICCMTFFYFLERKEFSYKNEIYDYSMKNLNERSITFLANIRWINLRFDEDADDVEVILSDLETFKKRFLKDNVKIWISILIEAIEHLFWIDSDKARNAVQDCMDEISKYPEYQAEFDKKLDYLDRIEELVASVNALPKILPVDIELIHTILMMSGNSLFTRSRRLILRFASALADDVLRAFMVFDYLQEHHSLVAIRLSRPLQLMFLSRHSSADELTGEQIDNAMNKIREIVKSHNNDVSSSRLSILKYYLEEQFDPSIITDRFYSYYESIQEAPGKKQEVEELDKWLFQYLNDNTVELTYYTIMCCDLEDMEEYDN
ncbi:MAG: hypothetical protein IKS45_04455 [Thermoguttaceae bacterium]|nr:hypothetical protein [Thermoguttaceae bacterium]